MFQVIPVIIWNLSHILISLQNTNNYIFTQLQCVKYCLVFVKFFAYLLKIVIWRLKKGYFSLGLFVVHK